MDTLILALIFLLSLAILSIEASRPASADTFHVTSTANYATPPSSPPTPIPQSTNVEFDFTPADGITLHGIVLAQIEHQQLIVIKDPRSIISNVIQTANPINNALSGLLKYQNIHTSAALAAPSSAPTAVQSKTTANAAIMTMIYGQQFYYSSPAYQARNTIIYFSNNNGETIHRVASNVTLGFMFNSLHIGLTDKCFTFPDSRAFCTNANYTLKFYVNHHQVPDLKNYVFKDQDRLLISYGNENDTQIQEQLRIVDSIKISTDNSLPPPIPIPTLPPQELAILDKENDPNKLIIEGRAFLNSVISPVPAYYYFDKALKLEPTNSTAQEGKEEASNSIAQFEQSLSNADVQLSANPHDQGALITRAQSLVLLEEYRQTSQSERSSLDKALTNSTTSNFNILEEQYRTLDLMGKYNETLPIIDKLIGEFAGEGSDDWLYLQSKAISLYKLGRYDEASLVLDQSNQVEQARLNGNPNTIYDIAKGIIYDKMGKPDLANTYYDLAGIDQTSITNGKLDFIIGNFAMNPIFMGDYETALEYLDKVPPSSSDYAVASVMKVVAQDRLAEASTFKSSNSISLIQIAKPQSTYTSENVELKIPNWIKNDAKWWSEGSIEDDDFVKGVQYMMQSGIMKVPNVQPSSTHDAQIPSWIKTAAGLWSNEKISDDEFVRAMQYLIQTGIIQLKS